MPTPRDEFIELTIELNVGIKLSKGAIELTNQVLSFHYKMGPAVRISRIAF